MHELKSSEAPAPGTVLAGRYRVERVLGSGGEGVVLLALHLGLMARVALKLPHRSRLDEPRSVRRAFREARAAFALRSEHVARVLDAGTLDDGMPFLVLEYLEGTDLRRLVAQRGALPVSEAVGYVLQACEAIAEAHAAGIVHRDLKPSNLFLTQRADGTPLTKVLDFGIAKLMHTAPNSDTLTELTLPGDAMGSPRYMSPEQIRNVRGVDHRTDIWAIGAILYELIAGVPAFCRTHEALFAVTMLDPLPLEASGAAIPREIRDLITRCLRKDPAERPPAIADVVRELAPWAPSWASLCAERALGTRSRALEVESDRLDALTEAMPRRRERRRANLVLVVAASASALALTAGLALWHSPGGQGMASAAPARPYDRGDDAGAVRATETTGPPSAPVTAASTDPTEVRASPPIAPATAAFTPRAAPLPAGPRPQVTTLVRGYAPKAAASAGHALDDDPLGERR